MTLKGGVIGGAIGTGALRGCMRASSASSPSLAVTSSGHVSAARCALRRAHFSADAAAACAAASASAATAAASAAAAKAASDPLRSRGCCRWSFMAPAHARKHKLPRHRRSCGTASRRAAASSPDEPKHRLQKCVSAHLRAGTGIVSRARECPGPKVTRGTRRGLGHLCVRVYPAPRRIQ